MNRLQKKGKEKKDDRKIIKRVRDSSQILAKMIINLLKKEVIIL